MASYNTIWQDYLVLPDAVAGEEYSYRLKIGSTTIFEGMTVPVSSGSVPVSVNISRLVESYISTPDLNLTVSTWYSLGYLTVTFYKVSGSTETLKGTYYFCNDWSDDVLTYTTNTTVNDPINGHGYSGMLLPFSVYKSNSDTDWTVNYTTTGGTVQTISCGNPTYDFSCYVPNITTTNIASVDFKKGSTVLFSYDTTYCENGVLYYRNRFGGWDAFLIEGNIYKKEDYEKEQYTITDSTNTVKSNWEKRTDKVKISTTYDAYTGWLSDAESERLVYHLLSSPDVYYKPVGEDLIAVNITNTNVEYKKFKNGRSLNRYTISFEESKKKTIKK